MSKYNEKFDINKVNVEVKKQNEAKLKEAKKNQPKEFTITIQNSENDIKDILSNVPSINSKVNITKINNIPVNSLQPNIDLIRTIFPEPKQSNWFTRKQGGKRKNKTRRGRK